ncbi:MAG: dihydropteroate synthase [Candidatus Electrothrix sp. GW3-4]|uniref:dihydropteroate synthase n=1 Tax=Candidatus Electrothrix sp. GW3-4 TaxID=3126740 RepID=UPI0030D58EF9
MSKVQVMGILNVTPDSFSDGGQFSGEQALREQVEKMLAHGVDIIDIGGESTRPFAEPVPEQEELERVIPAIKAVRALSAAIPISIDTTKARVVAVALEHGATIINDISALRQDPEMITVARACDAPIIIMHMQGRPEDMQVAPQYEDVVAEIKAFFQERTGWLEGQGIARQRIILDPGIGFGKTLAHNLAILRNVRAFKELGYLVLIGHSRKSFMEKLLGTPVGERDCPTAIISALCAQQGADILRVHDVAKTVAAVRLAEELGQGPV